MADTLIEFKNLEAVLKEFAQEFRETYRAELVKHDRFTTPGPDNNDRLIDSVDANTVETMVQYRDNAYSVSINLKEYWKYVENDTRPHWPPPDAILRWVTIKPVIPYPDKRGRLPSPRSLAFLIGRKISQVGTKGSHDFETSREAVLARFRTRIRVAMAADVREYVRKVLAL